MANEVTTLVKLTALTELFRTTYLQVSDLRCYKNNVSPGPLDVTATYTESTFTGYASQATGAWPSATNDGATIAYTQYASYLIFTCTGGSESVYGIYLNLTAGSTLVYAQRLAVAPFTISNGLSVIVQPYWSLINQ